MFKPPVVDGLTHLAAGEDAQTAGALVVEEAPDEVFVVRLLHSLHHVLQGVGDAGLLEQRQHQLAAPPAGQVVQRQQTPAHPLRVRQIKEEESKTKTPHLIPTSAQVQGVRTDR